MLDKRRISIHAPARGATVIGSVLGGNTLFQSTLPRGERPMAGFFADLYNGFQSTLPRGERLRKGDRDPAPQEISIHAPARGATRYSSGSIRRPEFQSTLPRGERPGCLVSFRGQKKFQSTLPRGERQVQQQTANNTV